jgi:hypothetical protein
MSHTAARRRGAHQGIGRHRPAGVARSHLTGSCVHGIVPAGTKPPGDDVALVPYRRVAALVRPAAAELDGATPDGAASGGSGRSRRDLIMAHAALLDTTAATTPVIPMRLGTTLDSPEAVTRDLLAPYHDTFLAALGALTGRAQFTIRARYDRDAIVREVLQHDPGARRLHQRMQDAAGDGDHGARMVLGEAVARGILTRREADAATLAETLRPYASMAAVQAPTSVESYRIADAAFVVELRRQTAFEEVLEQLAARWRNRARLRLLGPMAAYHFADHLINAHLDGP